MTFRRRIDQGMRGLLAGLVAIAFLLGPIASAQAQPCHDFTHHRQDLGDHRHTASAEQASAHSLHQQGDMASEHPSNGSKNCCASICGTSQALLTKEAVSPLHAMVARSGLGWVDEAGKGIAFAPIVGPPRLPV
jgi:hypothetical protein